MRISDWSSDVCSSDLLERWNVCLHVDSSRPRLSGENDSKSKYIRIRSHRLPTAGTWLRVPVDRIQHQERRHLHCVTCFFESLPSLVRQLGRESLHIRQDITPRHDGLHESQFTRIFQRVSGNTGNATTGPQRPLTHLSRIARNDRDIPQAGCWICRLYQTLDVSLEELALKGSAFFDLVLVKELHNAAGWHPSRNPVTPDFHVVDRKGTRLNSSH